MDLTNGPTNGLTYQVIAHNLIKAYGYTSQFLPETPSPLDLPFPGLLAADSHPSGTQ